MEALNAPRLPRWRTRLWRPRLAASFTGNVPRSGCVVSHSCSPSPASYAIAHRHAPPPRDGVRVAARGDGAASSTRCSDERPHRSRLPACLMRSWRRGRWRCVPCWCRAGRRRLQDAAGRPRPAGPRGPRRDLRAAAAAPCASSRPTRCASSYGRRDPMFERHWPHDISRAATAASVRRAPRAARRASLTIKHASPAVR